MTKNELIGTIIEDTDMGLPRKVQVVNIDGSFAGIYDLLTGETYKMSVADVTEWIAEIK